LRDPPTGCSLLRVGSRWSELVFGVPPAPPYPLTCCCAEPRIGSDAERSLVDRVELEEVSRDPLRAFVVLVRELSPRRDEAP
jgi:hypothetical protein